MKDYRLQRVPLTERKTQVYEFIVQYLDSRGYPPTLRETGRELGVSPSYVKHILDALVEEGAIERDEGVFRGIRLVK